MGTDDEWCEEVSAAGRRAGEILWRLPLHPEYADLIKGRYGDIINAVENRRAASVTAAEFLKRFVGDVPWAHLDIAGTAWDTNKAYAPKGGTGYGVRLLVELASSAGRSRLRPAMDFDLSADHELIRRTVRDFAEGEVAPVAEELDREKRFPYEIVAKLGELGLMGIPFPEEYGGAGGDTLAYAIAVEELTRVDSSRGDHDVRAHVARHAADLPVRLRGAEAASGCRELTARRASSARSG